MGEPEVGPGPGPWAGGRPRDQGPGPRAGGTGPQIPGLLVTLDPTRTCRLPARFPGGRTPPPIEKNFQSAC